MSLLGGFVLAFGPALFLMTAAWLVGWLMSRSASPDRSSTADRSRGRRRRDVAVLLGAAAAGALVVAIGLDAWGALDSGWALVVMGAGIGALVGVLVIASLDEGDAVGQAEEGWGTAPPAPRQADGPVARATPAGVGIRRVRPGAG